MADSHANFSYSTVLTAPSPATSGTSVTLATGGGALMPTAPFNATIWPAGVAPISSNAEIARVTAKAGDVLTITRAQEGTAARAVIVGDQVVAAVTAKTLTDIEPKGTIILTDGATPALDASLGDVFRLAAAGNRTIAVPTNPRAAQRIIIQHFASGGARTLSLNTGAGGFRFNSDITALTATASGKTDYIGALYNDTDSKWDVIAVTKGS